MWLPYLGNRLRKLQALVMEVSTWWRLVSDAAGRRTLRYDTVTQSQFKAIGIGEIGEVEVIVLLSEVRRELRRCKFTGVNPPDSECLEVNVYDDGIGIVSVFSSNAFR